METPEGRRRYIERLRHLTTNVFDVARLTNRVNELAEKAQNALGRNLPARLQHQLAMSALLDRIVRREASVREQLGQVLAPLHFGPGNEVALTGWRLSRDYGNPSFRRSANPRPTLEIAASGGRAYGSWRTEVFLDAGEYRFVGKVKLLDPEYGEGVTKGGATLRASSVRDAKMLADAPDWTTLIYDFTIAGQQDVELLCEFRASQGRALFDLSTLKLLRKRSVKLNGAQGSERGL
jgi:hypothetical protein